MIYKAQSPAGFAEEYIVESIWSGRFPPGTILPAERELSELIGVTRTTLREVLQRLARDGWLTIQHGKPTRVNDFWETCGLNILEALARLDEEGIPELVDHLLAARNSVSMLFIRGAIKVSPEKVQDILRKRIEMEDDHFEKDGKQFAELDYQLTHDLALALGNPVYVLMMNGFKGLYSRIGGFYFAQEPARELARNYYKQLLELAEKGDHENAPAVIRQYGMDSGKIWYDIREDLPPGFAD